MDASRELLLVAEKALGKAVALHNGLLRVAIEPLQKKAFFERSQQDREAIWVPDVRSYVPDAIEAPGLWIPSGITVFSKLYLEGLWKACEKAGAVLRRTKIEAVEELKSFDAIILCSGAAILQFPVSSHLLLQPLKGQTVLCEWDHPVAYSLMGLGHITPTENPNHCQIGSTYERGALDLNVTREAAAELLEKVAVFYPPARQFRVVSQAAAIRINVPDGKYRPLIKQVAPRIWVFTGLGSRGLLYHALLGKQLAGDVMRSLSAY
jgi:glycine/D-amino acid oxidase-like deaminating enzyme